jgi:parvulin-like peptidyl-prolyl isomerase
MCSRAETARRSQALRQLLFGKWVEAEAARNGVRASREDVRRALAQRLGTQLRRSGLSRRERFMARVGVLWKRLRRRSLTRLPPVTAEDVARYYRAHRSKFSLPASRDLLVVVTRGRPAARTALHELRGGASFAAVARRYSIDLVTRQSGGRLPRVERGPRGPLFDRPVFSAPLGQLVGPVATPLGFMVFTATAERRARQVSLQDATSQIRRQLLALRRGRALGAFTQELHDRWRAETRCSERIALDGCTETDGGGL